MMLLTQCWPLVTYYWFKCFGTRELVKSLNKLKESFVQMRILQLDMLFNQKWFEVEKKCGISDNRMSGQVLPQALLLLYLWDQWEVWWKVYSCSFDYLKKSTFIRHLSSWIISIELKQVGPYAWCIVTIDWYDCSWQCKKKQK